MTSHLQIQFWNECHIFICLLHTVHFLQQGKQAEFSIHIACPFIKKAEFIKRHPCLSSFLLHIFSGCNVSLLQFVMIATAHRENPFTGNNVFTHKLCVSIRNVFYTLYIKILLIFFCSSNERLGKKLVALYCREFFFPPLKFIPSNYGKTEFFHLGIFPLPLTQSRARALQKIRQRSQTSLSNFLFQVTSYICWVHKSSSRVIQSILLSQVAVEIHTYHNSVPPWPKRRLRI